MGDREDKMYIKNAGTLIAFVTLLWGVWYTLLDLDRVMLDESFGLFLRVIGIMAIVYLAYVPYYLLCYFFDKTSYRSFVVWLASIFFISDLFVRITLFFGNIHADGFIVVLSHFFVTMCSIFGIIGIFCVFQYICVEKGLIAKFLTMIKKIVHAFMRGRMF